MSAINIRWASQCEKILATSSGRWSKSGSIHYVFTLLGTVLDQLSSANCQHELGYTKGNRGKRRHLTETRRHRRLRNDHRESQLQLGHFSLSNVENVDGEPRGDSSRIAAVRVPSLLDDTLLRPLEGGHVGAVTPDGVARSTDFELGPGGTSLGRRGWERLGPFLSTRRRFVGTLLPLVPRGPLGGYPRLLPPRHVLR